MAAAAALGPADQLEKKVPLVRDDRRRGRGVTAGALEQPAPERQVGLRPAQQAERVRAVAAGAADLLVIRLDRPWRPEVDDRAHVGAIDAHAEGVCGADDVDAARRESRLGALAARGIEARVIDGATPAGAGEPRSLRLGQAAGGSVDNRCATLLVECLGQQCVDLAAAIPAATDLHGAQRQVRAREAAHQLRGVGRQPEPEDDLVADDRCRRRRAGEHMGRPELPEQRADLEVLRAEIVAPLADAVRLVDRDQRAAQRREQLPEVGRNQTLGCDVEEPVVAAPQADDTLPHRRRIERRGKIGRRDAAPGESRHLVLHQRDQRRHHQRRAGQEQRGQLVAKALAAAGRRHQQHAAALEQERDRLALPRPEAVVAEARERRVDRDLLGQEGALGLEGPTAGQRARSRVAPQESSRVRPSQR